MEMKDLLKKLRKERGYSAQEVADGCEMSLGVYKKYESGERGVGVPALSKLADFYGVTTDYLLGRDPMDLNPLEMLIASCKLDELEAKFLELYVTASHQQRVEYFTKTIDNLIAKNEPKD